MKLKINRNLLPVKAHFFFFFAALGPILPQLNVFGRQLGVSPGVMGMVTAILPLLWAVAKPLFGYVVDYFSRFRKLIFMLLITLMTTSYCGLWFLPMPTDYYTKSYRFNSTVYLARIEPNTTTPKHECRSQNTTHDMYFESNEYIGTVLTDFNVTCSDIGLEVDRIGGSQIICKSKDQFLVCYESGLVDGFYSSYVFWCFVTFMCVGTVAFNVANCIGDAVCFDVLGPENGSKYGYQRAWGTAGYGATALLGGWLVDRVSKGALKDFTPAFILALAFTVLDLISCRKLNLPTLSAPSDAGKALKKLLKVPRVVIFIIFAIVAGTFDSFIIYYMFWYLEEMAEATGYMSQIKLIEGVVVAGQSFIGELLFFFFSGKIIKKWGHGLTLTICLACYGLRLALISFITHPWHLVFIESIMQGPTYALCYATIVGYAAEVAPEGYSATMQGIVAGMDDGVGFALGSLLGGQLYSYLGGCNAFRLMSIIGLLGAFVHALLYKVVTSPTPVDESDKVSEFTPEAEKMLSHDISVNGIYNATVEPVTKTG